MKRKLLIIGAIIASIGLTACGSNEEVDPNLGVEDKVDKENEDIIEDDEIEEDIETKEVEQDEREGEGTYEDEADIIEDGKGGDIIMSQDEMIEKSDYIVKVKMIQKGQDNLELKILDNIKGKLSKEDITNTDLFKKNRAYLVFLENGDNGIEPTNGDNSYILLEGDNHEIFEKINKNR